MRPAEEIEQGSCFRKKNGTYAYLRISDSAAKFHGLKHETHIYGVCFNGNMVDVERGKMVEPVDISVMDENREGEAEWDREFGHGGKPEWEWNEGL